MLYSSDAYIYIYTSVLSKKLAPPPIFTPHTLKYKYNFDTELHLYSLFNINC